VSATATTTSEPTTAREQRTEPDRVNLTAFESRLMTTCTSRSASPVTAGTTSTTTTSSGSPAAS
jgi:hypothetical protein